MSWENYTDVAKIIFNTASTNLGLMLNQEVTLGEPTMIEHESLTAVLGTEAEPWGTESQKIAVFAKLSGSMDVDQVFLLTAEQAKYLANTMLGNTDAEVDNEPLDELQSSAVGEIFSQILNASITQLSTALDQELTVSSPTVLPFSEESIRENVPHFLALPFVEVKYPFQVEDGNTLEMIQWLSTEEAEQMAQAMSTSEPGAVEMSQEDIDAMMSSPMPSDNDDATSAGSGDKTMATNPVTVQPVQFSSFENQPDMVGDENRNLDLVMDVKLSLTVQLGEAELPIKEVLELTRGSVIELDRVAGEPVDLYANGKLIARGEVVVIEDNFGLRITSIVSPQERLRELAERF